MGVSSPALVTNVKTKKKQTNQKSQTLLMSFAFQCGTHVAAAPPGSRGPARIGHGQQGRASYIRLNITSTY